MVQGAPSCRKMGRQTWVGGEVTYREVYTYIIGMPCYGVLESKKSEEGICAEEGPGTKVQSPSRVRNVPMWVEVVPA